MAAKKLMSQVIPQWEAFLQYGGERDLIADIRALQSEDPEDLSDIIFQHLSVYVSRSHYTNGEVPQRNDQEKLYLVLRQEVHDKLDDILWHYIEAAVQKIPTQDNLWFANNVNTHKNRLCRPYAFGGYPLDLTPMIRRELGLNFASGPTQYIPSQCKFLQRVEYNLPYAQYMKVAGIPFIYTRPGRIEMTLEKHVLIPSEFHYKVWIMLADWEIREDTDAKGSWIPVVSGFRDLWRGSETLWTIPERILKQRTEKALLHHHPRFQTFKDCSELIPLL